MRNIVLCLAAVAGLTGCVIDPGALTGAVEPERSSNVPRDVSPAALAALPRGMSPEFLVKDDSGCYGLALEAREPLRGVPLLNDAGRQVCDA